MKNRLTKNLIILGTIIFSLALANGASASSRCYGYYCSNYLGSYNVDYNSDISSDYSNQSGVPVVNNNYYYPATAKAVTAPTTSSATGTATGTATGGAINSAIPNTASGVNNTSDSNTSNNGATTNSSFTSTRGISGNLLGASAFNGLTALSLRGSGGFMPSSIWQWILVVILILIIIILGRTLLPKKQESHDPHASHAAH